MVGGYGVDQMEMTAREALQLLADQMFAQQTAMVVIASQLAGLLGVSCDDLADAIATIKTDLDTPGVVEARGHLADMIRGAIDPRPRPQLRLVDIDTADNDE
jgi:hypothetical protein